MNPNKLKHFYLNKYIFSCIKNQEYLLCYNYKYKVLWFRVPKAGSRTINYHLSKSTPEHQYIYSSAVSYSPLMFKNYLKIAFVRNPLDRFISTWKNKVIEQNYFDFSAKEHKEMKEISHFIKWTKKQNLNKCDQHLRLQSSLIDLNNIDQLGRMENFAEDLERIMNIAGISVEKIVKKNSSKKIDVHLSTNDIHLLREIYSKDFQILYPNS